MNSRQQKIWAALTQPLRLATRFSVLAIVGLTLSFTIAACSAGSNSNPNSATQRDVELTLVSFAVTKAAHAAIIPKFVAKWQQEHNQTVTFRQSYGGSGSQTRAVIDGLEADIVHLALGLDTQKIEQAGLIQPGWEKKAPNNAIVSKSVAALITREGNPKNIKTWANLAQDNIKVITADPKTSGVARWNFLALWNSAMQAGNNEAKATEFVTRVYKNVPILAKDAREALDIFVKQGQGDALINYENEIILAQQKGEKATFVIPDVNIAIENPIAVVDKNVDKHGTRQVAAAYVQFLFTPTAQQEFAKVGFRPVEASVAQAVSAQYPPVKTLVTVQDYGGWSAVQKKFFADGALFDQMQAQIKR